MEVVDYDSDNDEDLLLNESYKIHKNLIIFEGIHCKRSFFIFSKKNILRITCYKIVKHRLFD